MPKEFARSERVAQLISRELALILRNEVSDPRVSGLTVTEVEVTRDLRQAKVFLSCMLEDEVNVEEVMSAVDRAAGFIRRKLAASLELRHCPTLLFAYDSSMAQGEKINALINRALNSD